MKKIHLLPVLAETQRMDFGGVLTVMQNVMICSDKTQSRESGRERSQIVLILLLRGRVKVNNNSGTSNCWHLKCSSWNIKCIIFLIL